MRRPPRIVELEVTLACNLRCIHCYCMAGRRHERELKTEEIRSLMADLKDMGVWALDLVGGEPFTRPDIFDLLRHAKEIGLRVMINTNGTLVTEDVALRLKESNPDTIVGVSLDGPDPETNDLVRGEGNFERAIRGLRIFVDHGFDPVILHVVNAVNWRRFEEMIDLAKNLGVRKIYVDRFIPVGRGKDSAPVLDMDTAGWMEAISHVRSVIEEHEAEIVFYIEENISGDPCSAGVSHASILVDGTVVPCGHFRYTPELYMGNIRYKKFSDIWNEYDPLVLGRPKECLSCPLLESCGGGCRAVSLHEYSSLDIPDVPICNLNRIRAGLDTIFEVRKG